MLLLMKRLLPLLSFLTLLAAGCAQVDSSTVISADGKVERRVSVTVDNSTNPTAVEGGGTKPATLIAFNPAANWKVEEKLGDKGQDILTAARELQAGEKLDEEFTLSDKRSSLAGCRVEVEKLADGSLAYTETWTWKGDVKESGTPIEKLQSVVDEKLEPWGISEAERKTIVERVRAKSWRALFGPGDPLLTQVLTNPNQGVRKLNNVVAQAFLNELEPVAGHTREEKLAVIKEMVNGLDAAGNSTPEAPGQEGEGENVMVSILSRVKGPGAIVDHNGEIDIIENEVFWSMYLEASMVEPVVLRAVFKP